MQSNQWIVNSKQRCDLEMLTVGAFAPLTGFLSQADYESVLSTNRLVNGSLWPIPITLDVSDEFATQINTGDTIDLIDNSNILLARMTISTKWRPDKCIEANEVFGN